MGCALSHDFSLIFLWLCWAIKTEILFQKGFHPIVIYSCHFIHALKLPPTTSKKSDLKMSRSFKPQKQIGLLLQLKFFLKMLLNHNMSYVNKYKLLFNVKEQPSVKGFFPPCQCVEINQNFTHIAFNS